MRYCSPLNPVFVDLVETAFVTHIKAYPDAEYYGLTEAEFPPGGAGVKAFFISAATGEGVAELIEETLKLLGQATVAAAAGEKRQKKVFRPQPKGAGPSVYKEGDTFVVVAPELERILVRTGAASTEVHGQLRRQLARLGIDRALQKSGVQPGDKIRCGNLEWEW